jgi:hypothetical protein
MKLIPSYFIISMFITMLILYLICPEPEVIVKYPNPANEVSDIYIDDNGVCYRYHRKDANVKK